MFSLRIAILNFYLKLLYYEHFFFILVLLQDFSIYVIISVACLYYNITKYVIADWR